MGVAVSGIAFISKEIQEWSGLLLEMIRLDIRVVVGKIPNCGDVGSPWTGKAGEIGDILDGTAHSASSEAEKYYRLQERGLIK